MPHFVIVLILYINLLNFSWIKKMSIFEEYGAFKARENTWGLYCEGIKYEPAHDKTNKMACDPVKTQISISIRPVRSESLLFTQWVAKDPNFLHVDSETDQVGQMPRLT